MNIDRAGEHGDEGIGVERQREGLEQHQEADADDRGRDVLQQAAPQPDAASASCVW